MRMEFLNRLQLKNRIAVKLAGITFIVGSIIFLLYVLTSSSVFVILGIGFLLLALIVNSILFLIVTANYFFTPAHFKEVLFTLYTTSLNLPIAVLYIHIALELG